MSKLKMSDKPARGGWAPGSYVCECFLCNSAYEGGRDSFHCADCAYGVVTCVVGVADQPDACGNILTADALKAQAQRDTRYHYDDEKKQLIFHGTPCVGGGSGA